MWLGQGKKGEEARGRGRGELVLIHHSHRHEESLWGQWRSGSRSQSQLSLQGRSQKGEPCSKAFYSKLTEERHSHMWWEVLGGVTETWKPYFWWPALFQSLLPSFTNSSSGKQLSIFTHEHCMLWIAHIFFYWAFSIMDNKFIQTFSPSKNMMKYKTGILH